MVRNLQGKWGTKYWVPLNRQVILSSKVIVISGNRLPWGLLLIKITLSWFPAYIWKNTCEHWSKMKQKNWKKISGQTRNKNPHAKLLWSAFPYEQQRSTKHFQHEMSSSSFHQQFDKSTKFFINPLTKTSRHYDKSGSIKHPGTS